MSYFTSFTIKSHAQQDTILSCSPFKNPVHEWTAIELEKLLEEKAKINKCIRCKVLAVNFQNSSVPWTELTSLLFSWQYVSVESGSDI